MIKLENWGLVNYQTGLDHQERLFNAALESKINHEVVQNTLILCQHTPVFTLGKSGKIENLLVNEAALSKKGIDLVHIKRGGDITFHGPGQIVGYPIFDLDFFHLGLKQYIYKVEDAIIKVLEKYGLKGERLEGATGVWLDASFPGKQRKICAIGVFSRKFITMHGFAFNVNTDLQYFHMINPCGFVDKGVTSMKMELGRELDIEQVNTDVYEAFMEIFTL